MVSGYAILSAHPGWHGKSLRKALEARGATAAFARLEDCSMEVAATGLHIDIPGFSDLPEGVFVREVPGGSLEEVIFYLDILHGLEQLGVPIYNDAGAIERSVDKVHASMRFALCAVPTPRTFAVRSLAHARTHARAQCAGSGRLVAKPIFGSQGKGVQLLDAEHPDPDPDISRGVYYLQEYIAPESEPGCDWRILVVGGRARAAMRREGNGWISNLAEGGTGHAAPLEAPFAQLAQRATEAVGMSYAGVDVLRDRDGKLWVTEVNSIPAWRGLQEASRQDISGLLAAGFLDYCKGRRRRAA